MAEELLVAGLEPAGVEAIGDGVPTTPKIDLRALGGVEMFGSGLGMMARRRFCCWICRSNSCCCRATCLSNC